MEVFPFILAEALGKTLEEIGQMTNHEYIRWAAFYAYRRAQQELAGG